MLPSLKTLYFNVTSYRFTGNGGSTARFLPVCCLEKAICMLPRQKFPLATLFRKWSLDKQYKQVKKANYKKTVKASNFTKVGRTK